MYNFLKSFITLVFLYNSIVGISQNWNTFTTDYGVIQFGPANPNWAHIYSSKPFIFNQDIYALNGTFAAYQSTSMQFKVNYGSRMKINASGNVVIGNSSPVNEVSRLFVSAYPNLTGKVVVTSKSNYSPLGGYGIVSSFRHKEFNAFSAINYVTSEEVFIVKGNGHVFATEIKVRQTPFPDYVFDKKYNLLEIKLLESYIECNKHLPNIPPATEVEKNGIGVGELQRLQMEKIEELTLYILALNETINHLEIEIEKYTNH